MKILFAIKSLNAPGGGAERVFCTVCSELAARGHEIVVLTLDRPGGHAFYPLAATIRRIDLGIGDASARTGVAAFLRRQPALRLVVRAEQPAVAVGFMHSIYVPLAFALAGTGIPLIGAEHIVPEHYASRPLEYALMLAAAPLMTRVTVLSETIRASYPAVLRRRMRVMPNPVETPVGEAAPGLAKARYRLLNVARFDPQKDQATLLRAFALLAPGHPDWELRLVGEGALRPALERLVLELGLQDRVAMPGTSADIAAEYRAADLFVVPSRYEAFGLVTAEALSYGLPAVGFADCPGTNELIRDGIDGFLVAAGPDRPAALAATLARLMDDAALRSRLGSAGKSAGAGRSAADIALRWEKLLREAAEGRS